MFQKPSWELLWRTGSCGSTTSSSFWHQINWFPRLVDFSFLLETARKHDYNVDWTMSALMEWPTKEMCEKLSDETIYHIYLRAGKYLSVNERKDCVVFCSYDMSPRSGNWDNHHVKCVMGVKPAGAHKDQNKLRARKFYKIKEREGCWVLYFALLTWAPDRGI